MSFIDDLIDEGCACLPWDSIDEHGTRAAHLFEAASLPGYRKSLFVVDCDGIFLYVHERCDDIEAPSIPNFEAFPVLLKAGSSKNFKCYRVHEKDLLYGEFNIAG